MLLKNLRIRELKILWFTGPKGNLNTEERRGAILEAVHPFLGVEEDNIVQVSDARSLRELAVGAKTMGKPYLLAVIETDTGNVDIQDQVCCFTPQVWGCNPLELTRQLRDFLKETYIRLMGHLPEMLAAMPDPEKSDKQED